MKNESEKINLSSLRKDDPSKNDDFNRNPGFVVRTWRWATFQCRGCGCEYEGNGGSTTSDNRRANNNNKYTT